MLQVVETRTAVQSQRETQAGDIHMLVSAPGRVHGIWMTEEAVKQANEEGLDIKALDALIGGGYVRAHSVEYPIRGYYLDLMRENIARRERGESSDSLWRWRDLCPTPRSQVSAICRRNGSAWINRHGEVVA